MEPGGLADLEDLTLCSCCKLPFNETDQTPKVLACRHHFCLKCISTVMLKGRELYCIHCWKRTEMPDHKPENLPTYTAVLVLTQNFGTLTINPHHIHPKPPDKPVNSHLNTKMKTISENCHTHAMPFTLWCLTCQMQTCRACATATEHCNHQIKPLAEARDVLRSDAQIELTSMHKMVVDMQHMVLKQRDFLLKILDACTTLKTKVETDLVNHIPSSELADARDSLSKAKMYLEMSENQSPVEVYRLFSDLNIEKQRLHNKYQEMYLQCKLDDLIRHSSVIFDFELLKQALSTIHNNDINLQALGITNGPGSHNPVLFLANYCMSQLYSRHYISKQNQNYAVQNGNVEYPHMLSQQAVVPVMTSPVMNHKNNFTENISPKSNVFLNEGTMMTIQNIKPNLTYHDNNPMLGSPNIHKSNPYHFENTAALIPSVAHSTHSNQSSIIHSSQNSLISPTSMVPAAIVMPPQQGNIVHSPQTLIRNPSTHIYPVYYFNIEINGAPFGRILIEVRNDVAPKMSKNFGILCTGELGYGYKGCNIFQCWENESIITGDFELNNGRGGRSVFEEGFFMPDDTKILAIRGSVGMRRSQKRHDNMGLVGSQFRIILREMRGFTGIFAFVVEGLELIERISQSGDSAGKPQNNVVITSCGKMN